MVITRMYLFLPMEHSNQLGMLACACNLSIQEEAVARGSELEANLS